MLELLADSMDAPVTPNLFGPALELNEEEKLAEGLDGLAVIPTEPGLDGTLLDEFDELGRELLTNDDEYDDATPESGLLWVDVWANALVPRTTAERATAPKMRESRMGSGGKK